MATDHFDVIVVGVGGMGSAACFHLARRGLRVLGIEQFSIPHELGSSHGRSRIIRQAYFEHPDYVPLLRRAYELWQELESLAGETLMHLTGGLYIGPEGCGLVAGSLRAAKQHGLKHEILSAAQVKERWPAFAPAAGDVALFEPLAGYVVPEMCINAHVRLAQQHGATIHANERVLDWSDSATGVEVRTDRATYRAKKLAFTAGPWTQTLVRDLGVPLPVTRQVMAWFATADANAFAPSRFPIWAADRPAGGIYYGFPVTDAGEGLKAAIHFPGTVVDPNHVNRDVGPHELDELNAFLGRTIPSAGKNAVATNVCLYTNSPDGHFIIDRHPKHANVVLACGFSGHGFKFATVVGEIVADWCESGATKRPGDFLRVSRFLQQFPENLRGSC